MHLGDKICIVKEKYDHAANRLDSQSEDAAAILEIIFLGIKQRSMDVINVCFHSRAIRCINPSRWIHSVIPIARNRGGLKIS
jgi:hypothetical protein